VADLTLLEAAKHSQDDIERSVTKIIVENSPILEKLPMLFQTLCPGSTFAPCD